MTGAVLTISVAYDATATTAEEVAEALDVLLATARSTEGVLDALGRVNVGYFEVAPFAGVAA